MVNIPAKLQEMLINDDYATKGNIFEMVCLTKRLSVITPNGIHFNFNALKI